METQINWLNAKDRILKPSEPFKLNERWVSQYASQRPPFGFNGLGELVYMRTYSRVKEDGHNEAYWETCRRVVEGCYNMQKAHIERYGLGWDNRKAQKSAQEMYDRMFNILFTPPGRGLWAMGSPITEERGLYMALNNCAFVSTDNLKAAGATPFAFLMDVSMLGVGCGFDTAGHGTTKIKSPKTKRTQTYRIPDSREGWVISVVKLIDNYLYGTSLWNFEYDDVREAGLPIKGFGGKASGPEPLKRCHELLHEAFERAMSRDGYFDDELIADIMNLIGMAVVAGNVRRTAELIIGNPNSERYLDLKNYEVNPHREEFGWTSNNSIAATLGMNYHDAAERTRINGEPKIWAQLW